VAPVAHVPGSLAFIQQIVEVIDGDGNSRIPETPQWQVVISVDGSATGVISLDKKPKHLSWRPDGEWLVFVESGEMLAVSAAGKVCVLPQVATRPVEHAEWTNAGGGGTIVYATEDSIWTVPVKKMNRRSVCPELQLAKKQRLTDDGGQDRDPQWLETNNLIAFISNRPLEVGDTSRQNRIWAVPSGQPVPRPVVILPFSITYADWQISRTTPQKAQIGSAPNGRGGRD
jgi:Tol biopolymer transport system component